jgi:hypothetical protein
MATEFKQLPIRLQTRDAERLERLAQTYHVSQAEVLRRLVRWLDPDDFDKAIQRSLGMPR